MSERMADVPCSGAEPADDRPDTEVQERVVFCVEALVTASDVPLSVDRIVNLLETVAEVDASQVRSALSALSARYADSAIELVEVASGWRFQVSADYGDLVAKLWEEQPPKLSRALLETLAIICYRQPVARSDIEAVRGVSVSTNIIRTLLEYDWIRVVGHRDVPGRPALYATTRHFLDDFGVKRLSDLPSLPEIRDADALEQALARLQRDGGEHTDPPVQDNVAEESDTDKPPAAAPRGFE